MEADHLNGMLIARTSGFGREAYKVLWYLTANLDFDHFSVLDIGRISSDLGLKSQAVSRALRTLVDGDILVRGPRVGLRSSFRFSHRVADDGNGARNRPSLARMPLSDERPPR